MIDDDARSGAMERAAQFSLASPVDRMDLDKMSEASRRELIEREQVVRRPRIGFQDRRVSWERDR